MSLFPSFFCGLSTSTKSQAPATLLRNMICLFFFSLVFQAAGGDVEEVALGLCEERRTSEGKEDIGGGEMGAVVTFDSWME